MSIFDTPEYKERWAMYQSALDAGLPIVSTETCAIICAMLLVWGNTAEFTHNHRLVCELQYAQKRFGIEGGETPTDRNLTIVEPAHARDSSNVIRLSSR